MGELVTFILIPLAVLVLAYRVGHRIGKAEGRLLGRDEAASQNGESGTSDPADREAPRRGRGI